MREHFLKQKHVHFARRGELIRRVSTSRKIRELSERILLEDFGHLPRRCIAMLFGRFVLSAYERDEIS